MGKESKEARSEFRKRLKEGRTAWKKAKEGGDGPPAGKYEFLFSKADLKVSSKGDLMIIAHYVVARGEHKGEEVAEFFSLENEERMPFTKRWLRSITGADPPDDPTEVEDVLTALNAEPPRFTADYSENKGYKNVRNIKLLDEDDEGGAEDDTEDEDDEDDDDTDKKSKAKKKKVDDADDEESEESDDNADDADEDEGTEDEDEDEDDGKKKAKKKKGDANDDEDDGAEADSDEEGDEPESEPEEGEEDEPKAAFEKGDVVHFVFRGKTIGGAVKKILKDGTTVAVRSDDGATYQVDAEMLTAGEVEEAKPAKGKKGKE